MRKTAFFQVFSISAFLVCWTSVSSNARAEIFDSCNENTVVHMDEDMKMAVRHGIAKHLKDEDSAKYYGGQVCFDEKTNVGFACLELNAKNSYGGYAGKRVVWGYLTGRPNRYEFVVSPKAGLEERPKGINREFCANRGMYFD